MEQLLKYFIQETDKKLDDLKSDLTGVRDKLDDLEKFKATMIASARTTAFVVSAVCGAVTLGCTVVTVIFYLGK